MDKLHASLFSAKRDVLERGELTVKSGVIASRDDLVNWVAANDKARAIDQNDFKYLLSVWDGTLVKNKDEDWNTFYSAVQGFDLNAPQDVQDKREAWLRMEFEKHLDGPALTKMNQLLTEHLKETDDSRSAILKGAADLLDSEEKRGAFGPTTRPKVNKEGQPLAKKEKTLVIPDEVGWFWKRPGTPEDAEESESMDFAVEEDPALKAQVDARKRQILQSFDKWVRENPGKTQDEYIKKLNELMGGNISAGEAESFLRGGGPSAALFPNGSPQSVIESFKKSLNGN
jgi:hypothetical protein